MTLLVQSDVGRDRCAITAAPSIATIATRTATIHQTCFTAGTVVRFAFETSTQTRPRLRRPNQKRQRQPRSGNIVPAASSETVARGARAS